MPDPWILHSTPKASAPVRLFCFPYAGAGAAVYRAWGDALGGHADVLGVQPPGRGSRWREAPFTRLVSLAEAAAGALRPYLDRPFALFGHSLGGLVAFEVARALRRFREPAPVHLFVSARRGPRLPERDPPVHLLSDGALVDEVRRRYDAIPEAVLREPELLRIVLPTLRADMQALETYDYAPGAPLECPVTALGGDRDPRTGIEELDAWREETCGAFALRTFPGRHFFIETAADGVLQELRRCLSGAVPRPVQETRA